jgi:hypothetical protein
VIQQASLFAECAHPHTQVVPEKRGPHYARRVCTDCKKFLGWIPHPESARRRLDNFQILTALAKLEHLSDWERQFVRDLGSHKNISPKQQALLLQLRDKYLLHSKDGAPPN